MEGSTTSGGLRALTLGRRVREARKALGMTQADLARATRRSQATVSKWEAGRALPNREEDVPALAEALGLVADSLDPTAADPHSLLAVAGELEAALDGGPLVDSLGAFAERAAGEVGEDAPLRVLGVAPGHARVAAETVRRGLAT